MGYDGVELPLKAILFYGKDKFKRLLAKTGLRVIVMAMTDGPVAPGCGMLWGGPYPGFSAPPFPGISYKQLDHALLRYRSAEHGPACLARSARSQTIGHFAPS